MPKTNNFLQTTIYQNPMNYFNITTTVLSILLIALFVRTFRNVSLKNLYKNTKNRAIIDAKRTEAEKRGERPFYFERGKVVVYAKTSARATYDYLAMKRTQKQQSRTAKVAKNVATK